MLTISFLILTSVVALPSLFITPSLYLRTASLILVSTAVLSFNSFDPTSIGSGVGIYSGLYEVSSLTGSTDTIIFLIGSIAILPWAPKTIDNSKIQSGEKLNNLSPTISEYGILVLFTSAGSSFLISSADLVSIYLSIELQSFGVYILSTIYRDSFTSTDSGLKYFLLGGLSSCFILLGSGLLYSYTGTTNIESVSSLISVKTMDGGFNSLTIGLVIIVTGYLFKIAAAPFHNWAPDVYDGVPTIVTTWIATMPKISILVFLLNIQAGISVNIEIITGYFTGSDGLEITLLIASILSLIVGTVVGLTQIRIKRLLAYSTVSHVGFLLLALGSNSEVGIESYLFYILQYTITSLNSFLVILGLGYALYIYKTESVQGSETTETSITADVQYISSLAGQSLQHPFICLAIAASLFSIAGIPPMIGFFAKQSVLYAAISSDHNFIAFVGIVVSVISASYYLKVVRVLHFDSLTGTISQNRPIISNVHAFTISIFTMMLTLYIFNPSLVFDSTTILALNIFNS